MSASQGTRDWPNQEFWDRLQRLEGRHERAQSEYDTARRGPETLTPSDIEEVRSAWRRYCEVIAELDKTATEFEALQK